MARASTGIAGGGHDLRERGVLTMAGRPQHPSLHANPRQYPPQEQSLLWSRVFPLRSGTRSLYLPYGPAPELRWSKSSQSRLDLYRDTQTMWSLSTPTPV